MTDIINIPLNKLTAGKATSGRRRTSGGIDELAATIKAHGLQQNLVVRKDGRKFAVVAGRQAPESLAATLPRPVTSTGDIRCHASITEDGNATELSLAENVMREDMHPADQFEAFRVPGR